MFVYFIFFYMWQFPNDQVLAWGISYDNELEIAMIRNDCSTVQPIATYSFKNEQIEGILYATSCRDGRNLPSPLVDHVKYMFIDTGGSNPERCYGIVDTSTPSGIKYSWEFLGAVPGYSCSSTQTIHKLFPKGY
ncbi:MAG: hypothetical protein AAF298_27920 [Cyanobacteria bacterium P01_A01_bin.40]